MTSNIRKILFAVYAVALLGFLASMIWTQASIRSGGKSYKFKCRPVDPKDPFRGAYIRLNFERLYRSIDDDPDFGEYQYAVIEEDEEGYAIVSRLAKDYSETLVMIPLEVGYIGEKQASYTLPFSRYYMTEEKALAAETLIRDGLRDSTMVVCAQVFIDGSDLSLIHI